MDAVEANERGANMGVVVVVAIEGIVEMEEIEEDAIDIVRWFVGGRIEMANIVETDALSSSDEAESRMMCKTIETIENQNE